MQIAATSGALPGVAVTAPSRTRAEDTPPLGNLDVGANGSRTTTTAVAAEKATATS